jgi:hypothetical protein
MRGSGFALFALTAAALLGTLSLELGRGGADGTAGLAAPRAAPAPPAAPAQAPAMDRSEEWVATILARPLFSPDRRAPLDEAQSSATAPDVLPRLTGVLVSPAGKTAIFANPIGGKPIALREGGRIGGFTVQAIEAGQVTLTGPEGAKVLRPTFEPGRAGPGLPPPVAAAAPAEAPVQTAVKTSP